MERQRQIERLIGRFLDGETTGAEERELYAFFSGENVPEALAAYREMFAWFGEGIKEEAQEDEIPAIRRSRPARRFRIWGTAAAVAAVVAVLLIFRPSQTTEPKIYQESYIVRNGVKITDPEIVRPAIEATLRYVEEENKAEERLLYEAYADEIEYTLEQWRKQKELIEYINSFPEGEVRQEVIRRILLSNN